MLIFTFSDAAIDPVKQRLAKSVCVYQKPWRTPFAVQSLHANTYYKSEWGENCRSIPSTFDSALFASGAAGADVCCDFTKISVFHSFSIYVIIPLNDNSMRLSSIFQVEKIYSKSYLKKSQLIQTVKLFKHNIICTHQNVAWIHWILSRVPIHWSEFFFFDFLLMVFSPDSMPFILSRIL